ncbi:MAG: NUDIX hydrolase [Acidobacteria bacterium]|jgi:ADP-ribose pyrophosphatase YjhB (NUDIX family)|nr:NUDIX hydrolase [Acidobacteriota bacterium]
MLKKIVGTIWKKLTPAARLKITRATQPKFTVSVAAVITNERGEVLLLDHVLRPHSNWGIPGGFVKASEQPEDAIRREIREETGLVLDNLKMLVVRTSRRHVEILFRADARGEAVAQSREINQAAWFSLEAIPEDMSGRQKADVRDFLPSLPEK